MRHQKRLVGLWLWLAVGLFTIAKAQQAFYLPEFIAEMALKSEWTLKVGAAMPMGDLRITESTNGFPQGVKPGTSLDITYRYYRSPFFAVGAVAGAQLYGHDFAPLIEEGSYVGKLHTLGWEVYSAGILFQTRIPIISKLYVLAQVQARYVFALTPRAWAVETIPVLDDEGKRIGTDYNRTDILLPKSKHDALLSGEIGMQYRIKHNILAQFTVEYRRAVVGNYYQDKKTDAPTDVPADLEFRYSALMLNVGVTYAFGEDKNYKAQNY